ncbi:MAG TPA: hypothetical protein VFW86_02330, partial [Candidatus Limnocylindrales bacterium]|nr:hypothetical protein [Candidatus Limnocylindrales bacterium]
MTRVKWLSPGGTMNVPRSIAATALAGAMVLTLSGCGSAGGAEATPTATPASIAADPSASHDHAAQVNMFGGPVYDGDPQLAATAALIAAGGGAEDFSFQAALVSMLGQDTVDAEVAKLTTQYGADQVKEFIDGMDFAVNDAI